jgi:hypothetical protein
MNQVPVDGRKTAMSVAVAVVVDRHADVDSVPPRHAHDGTRGGVQMNQVPVDGRKTGDVGLAVAVVVAGTATSAPFPHWTLAAAPVLELTICQVPVDGRKIATSARPSPS